MTDENKVTEQAEGQDVVLVDSQPESEAAAENAQFDSAELQPPFQQQAQQQSQQPADESAEDKKAAKDEPPAARQKSKRGFPWFSVLLFILLLPTIAAVAWLAQQGDAYIKGDADKYAKVAALENQLLQQTQQLTAINQHLAESLAAAKAENKTVNERLQVVEQRVIAQNKRLLAMSTVTREDWLLAEAEYLLKLANQRVLIERSASGAEALLTEADAIMRDLADPDLFALRKAINSDLAALRLVQKIDVEGIYLSIDGLINHIEALPLQPTRQQVMVDDQSAPEVEASEQANGWWNKIKASFKGFGAGFGEYIRVRDHSVQARALLAPDTAQYLQHNIRLLLERAQLALLREQTEIYRQSLLQAESYIEKYLPDSTAAESFRTQLQSLAEKNIVTELPDISPSLELLHSYIEQLHDLRGAKPAAGAKS